MTKRYFFVFGGRSGVRFKPENLSDNLIVQLGTITEDLNWRWYERNTGQSVKHIQKRTRHPIIQMDGGDTRLA